jgi:hypothetical protein
VKIILLIQGHTHDFIDQEFSIWAAGEKRFSIQTLTKLWKFILLSFKSNIKKIYIYYAKYMIELVFCSSNCRIFTA